MPSCPVCHVAFMHHSKRITCSKCSATLHRNCTKIPLDQVESLTSGATPYSCHICVDPDQELRTALAQMTTQLTNLSYEQKEQESQLADLEGRPLESVRFVPPEPIIITLDTLPVELLELLFRYLCLSDRLQMSMVSKKLYNVFWGSPVGANLWKGLTFRISRIDQIQDLVNTWIFQMNNGVINKLVLDLSEDPEMDPLMWAKWDLLAPKLTSLTINHDEPLDIFRLLKKCSRLVTLKWIYRSQKEDCPDGYPKEDPKKTVWLPDLRHLRSDAVCLPELRHLHLNVSLPNFLDDILSIATAKSRLTTLNLKQYDTTQYNTYFKVLHRHVTRHSASLKSLGSSNSVISGSQLVALGSIPDLRLLELDISNCMYIDLESFVRFLRLQPNLISLKVSGCDNIFVDERWDTLKNELISLISGLKSLHVMFIMHYKISKRLGELIPQLVNLQKLTSYMAPTGLTNSLKQSLKKSSCTLLSAAIHITYCFLLHDDKLRNLRELTLLDDDFLYPPNKTCARIWQHCHNLEALDISIGYRVDVRSPIKYNNLRKLTDLTIRLKLSDWWTDSLAVMLKLPNLRRLDVDLYTYTPSEIKNFLEFNRLLSSGTPFLEYLNYTYMSYGEIARMFPGQDLMAEFRKWWPRLKASSFKPTKPIHFSPFTYLHFPPWIYPGRLSINDS